MSLSDGELPAVQATLEVDVSIIFDLEHDRELYEILLAQSLAPGSGFTVTGGSDHFVEADAWHQRARRRIRRADQVIVICTEHTDDSLGVFAELRLAQEEQKPYFLLWGRRDSMCTKPGGAKTSDGIYGWSAETIQDQLALVARQAQREKAALALKRPERQQRSAGTTRDS